MQLGRTPREICVTIERMLFELCWNGSNIHILRYFHIFLDKDRFLNIATHEISTDKEQR